MRTRNTLLAILAAVAVAATTIATVLLAQEGADQPGALSSPEASPSTPAQTDPPTPGTNAAFTFPPSGERPVTVNQVVGAGDVGAELVIVHNSGELVNLEDLRGVLHNHTTDSDGADSLEAMASAARDRGWEFFGVADHSPVASYANGLSADRLRDQGERIDRLNATQSELRVVKGLEADILPDGGLDIPEGCEEELDYVVASVHSAFRLAMEVQTDRLVRAVSHRACRVLGHPTGRLLLARPGYAVDLQRVLEACAEHGVAVEINASPYRLDLDWRWARRALELGIKLAVNPDAHSTAGLDDVRWGVAVARKAGATKNDLINCSDIDGFLRP